jgi:hypothetical protein
LNGDGGTRATMRWMLSLNPSSEQSGGPPPAAQALMCEEPIAAVGNVLWALTLERSICGALGVPSTQTREADGHRRTRTRPRLSRGALQSVPTTDGRDRTRDRGRNNVSFSGSQQRSSGTWYRYSGWPCHGQWEQCGFNRRNGSCPPHRSTATSPPSGTCAVQ